MSEARASAALELRYRRLLAHYPDDWRARNEEAVLGVLLDVAEASGRTAPTRREVLDLTARGLLARATAAASDDVRSRVAGICGGIGLGFAVAYFAWFIRPLGWGADVPVAHAGPAAILLVWLIVAGAVIRRDARRWQLVALATAAAVPAVLWSTRSGIDHGHALVITGWVRPGNANTAFLVVLAVLAALGPIDRRLMLRVAVVSAVAFALALWVTGAWNDSLDQSLWGSPSQSAFGAPWTLERIWGAGDGRMPVASDTPPFGYLLRGWLQASVLRLNDLAVGLVLVALAVSAALLRRGRTVPGRVLLLVTLPFVAALVACAAQPTGVWFQ